MTCKNVRLMTALLCLNLRQFQSFQLSTPRHMTRHLIGTTSKIRSDCNRNNRNLCHCDDWYSQLLLSSRPDHSSAGLALSMSNGDSDTNAGIASESSRKVDANADECLSAIFTQSKEEVHSLLVGEEIDMKLSLEDLKRCWTELGELIEFEEVFPDELEEMYKKSLKIDMGGEIGDRKLDQKEFFAFYTFIDELFEIPDEVEENEVGSENEKGQDDEDDNIDPIAESNKIKAELVSYLDEMTATAKQNNQLTCGFDCTDAQREVINDLITSLASIISPVNLVTNPSANKKKKMSEADVMGDWDLLYTCSHAMLINRSLSGLGRSTSAKAQFQGLRKRLSGSKYLGTVEYIETFGGGELGEDDLSFDVIVTGEWYFEEKINYYTKQPAPCLKVELEKVIYGPTTNGADQWSSLGPVKLTDFLYFDDDLMILRGNVNTSSLFVYRRAS